LLQKVRFIIPPLVILLTGICAYCTSLRGPFVFDDVTAIPLNPEIRSFAMALLPRAEVSAGRPLPTFTFAVNFAIHGDRPLGYHLVNLAIHLLAAIVVYDLCRRTLERLPRFAPHSRALACATAVLFVAHPLTTEVVDYTFQRTESMMALFALLTLDCLCRAADSAHARRWLIASVIACALGMGCKQSMVVLPLIAIAYDRTFLARTFHEIFARRRIFYIALFLTISILIYFQLQRTHYDTVGIAGARQLTPWTYLLTQSTVLSHYARLIFWPDPLSIDYYDWPGVTTLAGALPYAIPIVILLAVSIYSFFRRQPIGFVLLAAFLALAPTSSILPLPTEVAAERRMYLPLAFLLPAIVCAAYIGTCRLFSVSAVRLLSPTVVIFLVILMIRLDHARAADYASARELWLATVNVRPASARAWGNLAAAYAAEHDWGHAADADRRAITLDPGFIPPHQNLAAALVHLGRVDEAIAELRATLQIQDEPFTRILLEQAEAIQQASREHGPTSGPAKPGE
jgi:protein O-mannosyl-transferase